MAGKLPSRRLRHAYLKGWLAEMGEGAGVQLNCHILNGRRIVLGPRSVVNFGCLLDGRKHFIRIGQDVSIGPEAAILTLGHDPRSSAFEDQGGDVIIGDRVWIAYRAVILPGVTIGDGAVVGAGAVISKNVERYSIMAGNPAKKIGERPPGLSYQLSYRPWLG
ncbi:MAG: acyltransferase [Verrucomicrobiales bacterium]